MLFGFGCILTYFLWTRIKPLLGGSSRLGSVSRTWKQHQPRSYSPVCDAAAAMFHLQRGLRGSNASERVCSILFIEDLKNKFINININEPSGLTPLLKLSLVLQQECRQVLDGVRRSGTQTGSPSADFINQSQCNYMTDPLTMTSPGGVVSRSRAGGSVSLDSDPRVQTQWPPRRYANRLYLT